MVILAEFCLRRHLAYYRLKSPISRDNLNVNYFVGNKRKLKLKPFLKKIHMDIFTPQSTVLFVILQVWKQSSVPSSSLWRISEMWSSWLSSHCPCLPCWDSRSTWESWHKSASKTFPRNLQTSSLAQASTTSVMQIWLDFTGHGTNSTWTQVTGKKWWYIRIYIVSIFQEQCQNLLSKTPVPWQV